MEGADGKKGAASKGATLVLPGISLFLEELLFQAGPELAAQKSTWQAVRGLGGQREKVMRLNNDQQRCSHRPGLTGPALCGGKSLSFWVSAFQGSRSPEATARHRAKSEEQKG